MQRRLEMAHKWFEDRIGYKGGIVVFVEILWSHFDALEMRLYHRKAQRNRFTYILDGLLLSLCSFLENQKG